MKAPDRIDVARQALGQVLTHPATWAPFVPLAGAYAFLGAPWWLCLALMLAVVVVVGMAWGKRWPHLMDKVRLESLSAHRLAENAELGQRMNRVAQAAGQQPVGRLVDAVREAMDIKHAVEDRLYADNLITTQEEEVATMVGELVRTMVGEAERLTLAEGRAVSRAASERFDRAAATLRKVYSEIDVILDPVPEELRLPAGTDPLSRASERLDERLQLARNVRRHLERDMKIPEVESTSEASASPSVTTEN